MTPSCVLQQKALDLSIFLREGPENMLSREGATHSKFPRLLSWTTAIRQTLQQEEDVEACTI